MPIRIIPFVNDQYYHIFNRGVAHQPTFLAKRDYEKFLECVSFYRYSNLPHKLSKLAQLPIEERERIWADLETSNDKSVEIVAFCLMPNHCHLLVRQESDDGISKFMRHLSDSYTKYFNVKNERVGPLFQGPFKAVHVSTDEQLIHLSRYIHLNPLVSFVVREEYFSSYRWSSLKDYSKGASTLVDVSQVLSNFKSSDDYLSFVMNQADYAKELARIKHLGLE